jgi:hypothetical protein
MWLVSTLQRFAKGLGCAALLSAAVVGAAAQAQDFQIVVGERIVDETGEEQISWTLPGAITPEQFEPHFIELEPSVITTTLRKGTKTNDFILFACVNLFTGQLILFCDITIAFGDVLDDGGHVHVDPAAPRPLGQFNPSFGNSGSNGFLETSYTAPEFSGIWEMRVTGVGPAGEFIAPFESTIFIRVPGMLELLAGGDYNLVGQTSSHPANHFGTSDFNAAIVRIANAYVATFPGEKLDYNDMSLKFGGMFDFCAVRLASSSCPALVPADSPWQLPRKSHRFGIAVDTPIPNTANRRRILRQLVLGNERFVLLNPEPDHWHLRQTN